jgi:hypothetical protein
MPIDSNIAMGYRSPQFESPVNQMAAVMQLQGAQQTNELNRQKMEEYTRAREMEGMRRNALAGVDFNAPDSFNKVAQRLYDIGDLKGADEMLKARDERDYKQAQTGSEKAKAEKTGVEAKIEKTKLFTTRLPLIAQNPTDEAIAQWAKTLVQNDIMSMEQATAGMNQMLALPLEQRRQKLMESALSAEKALEQHYVTQNLGGTERVIGMPKYGAGASRVVEGSEAKVTKKPHEITMEQLARDRLAKETSADNVAHVITDDRGNVTMINKKGQVIGTQLQGVGKQSATYAKTAEQQKQTAREREMVISELTKAVQPGGLIDQSTGSGAGALYDASARFFGNATAGDIAIGQLKPVADLALKMVPRFEGPQSDKDTISYQQASGQLADPTLPREIRKAAANEVLRIMKLRKDQFGTQDTAPNAAPPAGFVPDN